MRLAAITPMSVSAKQPLRRLRRRSTGRIDAPPGESERCRILYVEDEDINWELTARVLGRSHDMHRARDAGEAFGCLKDEQFELILMDIQLRGSDLDGIEISRALRGHLTPTLPSYAQGVRSSVPIVFVTANPEVYCAQELTVLGRTELVGKPVDFARLCQTIERLLPTAPSGPSSAGP